MRFPISPHYPYVRHSTTGFTVVVRNNGLQKKPTYYFLMQTKALEIKEKLLRALDKEYNVVDMASVLEVITLLENSSLTKETLQKTRIGMYVNELRKKTDNKQLARRAKSLVKNWRQLLPDSGNVVNGEKIIGPTGPGPGITPNFDIKLSKSNIVPGSPHIKSLSPSIVCERSTSPFCSSASSSPQSVKIHLPTRPIPQSNSSQTVLHNDKVGLQNRVLFTSTPSKNDYLSSQVFKPVSPALLTTNSSGIGLVNCSSDSLPQLNLHSPCTSPAQVNSARSFCLTNTSAMSASTGISVEQQNYEQLNACSQSFTSGSVHSNLEIAKTNVANKRLRKSPIKISNTKRKKGALNNSLVNCHLQNGSDSNLSDTLQHSPSSSFKNFKTESENKKNSETNTCHDILKDRLSSITVGNKLSKVKTTQQLIEELQAKKEALHLPFPKFRECQSDVDGENILWKKGFNNSVPANELQKSKSELMKKFLLSSPESPSVNSGHESPITDRVSSPSSDTVPSKSAVISPDKDINVHFVNPNDAEIEQILSQLPPIESEVIFEEPPIPERPRVPSEEDVERYLSEKWEHVNGNYDMHGVWHPWQDCIDKEIAPGESMRILPYVNIDW